MFYGFIADLKRVQPASFQLLYGSQFFINCSLQQSAIIMPIVSSF